MLGVDVVVWLVSAREASACWSEIAHQLNTEADPTGHGGAG
jgi:hypothetical protein